MNIRITIERYDYFGGQKFETVTYSNLIEGWKAYKAQAKKDFDYSDAFQFTSYRVDSVYPATTKPQRPHARSAYEWEKMMYMATSAVTTADNWDIDDEDIII